MDTIKLRQVFEQHDEAEVLEHPTELLIAGFVGLTATRGPDSHGATGDRGSDP